MVSCLERQVYVLADRTLRDRVSSAQWEEVTRGMVERLKAGDLAGGLRRGIEASGRLWPLSVPTRRGQPERVVE